MSNKGTPMSKRSTFTVPHSTRRLWFCRSKPTILTPTAPSGVFTRRNSEYSLTPPSSPSISLRKELATIDRFSCYCNESCANSCKKFVKFQSIQSNESKNKQEAESLKPFRGCDITKRKPVVTPNIGIATVERVDIAMRNRLSALNEFIQSEDAYVRDLSVIVDGFIRMIHTSNSDIPLPDDLKCGKYRMIFANIEAIYEWHRDNFLTALQKSITSSSELGALIERSKSKFLKLYVTYCRNKPYSEHIVVGHLDYFDEIRSRLKCDLRICDLLIKPVQRITKYELLLKNIHKYTKMAGLLHELPELENAINVITAIPKQANVMMNLFQLQQFVGSITGELLLNDSLLCTMDKKTKPQVLRIFLFQQCIVFSEILCKKTKFESASYICKNYIQLNKAGITELRPNQFSLTSTDLERPPMTYTITTQTLEQNQTWVNTIKSILQSQIDFLCALEKPIAYVKTL